MQRYTHIHTRAHTHTIHMYTPVCIKISAFCFFTFTTYIKYIRHIYQSSIQVTSYILYTVYILCKSVVVYIYILHSMYTETYF